MFIIDFSLINVNNSGIILVSGMHINVVNFKSTFFMKVYIAAILLTDYSKEFHPNKVLIDVFSFKACNGI